MMADRRLYAYFAPVSTRLRLQTHIFSQVDYLRMGQRNPAFEHHFHEIAKAELEPEIPPIDLMIAGPEGGPSSDMQRYQG